MSQPQAKKQEKEKRVKGKKIHMYYELRARNWFETLKKCPRCGSFMAHHKERVDGLVAHAGIRSTSAHNP